MAHIPKSLVTAFLASTCTMRLTMVIVEQKTVHLHLTATAPTACCPCCAVPSSAVHCRYQRRLTDLPWGRRLVRLQLTVRKFVCRQPTCQRHIFTERLPDLVAAHVRKTGRLVAALQAIGMALGGNTGARLAARLRVPTSAAPLLRLVRGAPIRPMPGLHQIGVDE